ncbi:MULTISPECIES: hypothetical protein [Rhodococcus]|uniref:hypothetical protein n=1 Tax=Rhodococcus TaxID=1827 RepID=UPI00115FED5E|nr:MULTISPECIES: hypothetical protein [Rhodococcus]
MPRRRLPWLVAAVAVLGTPLGPAGPCGPVADPFDTVVIDEHVTEMMLLATKCRHHSTAT